MVGLIVAGIRKALLGKFFLPAFLVLVLVFLFTMGNPIGLLTSGGGWIIFLLMLLVSRVAAIVLDRLVTRADGDD